MDKRLLNILRCPVTHKGLSVLKKDQLDKVNEAIRKGGLVSHDGLLFPFFRSTLYSMLHTTARASKRHS